MINTESHRNKLIDFILHNYVFIVPLMILTILMLGNGFFPAFVTLRLQYEGFSEIKIGTIQSFFSFGMLFGGIVISAFIKKFGHRATYAIFCITLAQTILIRQSPSFVVWILGSTIAGFSMSALYVAIESWLLAFTNDLNRNKILSMYTLLLYGPAALSQIFLDFFPPFSNTPIYISACFCIASMLPLLIFRNVPVPLVKNKENPPINIGIIEIFKIAPLGILGCVASGFFLGVLYAFLVLYCKEIGMQSSHVMMSLILGGCLLQYPLIALIRFFNRSTLLSLQSIALIPTVLVLILLGKENYSIAILSIFIIGGLCFSIYPLSASLVCEKIKPSQIISATSIMLFTYCIGSTISPIAVGYLMKINYAYLPLSIAIGGTILGGIGFILRNK
jgi:MFS family permease